MALVGVGEITPVGAHMGIAFVRHGSCRTLIPAVWRLADATLGFAQVAVPTSSQT